MNEIILPMSISIDVDNEIENINLIDTEEYE